jgi:hypothetical protein
MYDNSHILTLRSLSVPSFQAHICSSPNPVFRSKLEQDLDVDEHFLGSVSGPPEINKSYNNHQN